MKSRRTQPGNSFRTLTTGNLAGFTFVEILMAVMFVGLALAPVAGLFISGSQGSAKVTNRAMALNLAAESLEVLSSVPFPEIRDNFDSYAAIETISFFGRDFTVTPSKALVWNDPAGEPTLIRLTVRASWKEKGKELSVSLGTMTGREEM